MTCIFKNAPICSVCLDSMKLQCLLNKPYKKITAEAKKDLKKLLGENLESSQRVE